MNEKSEQPTTTKSSTVRRASGLFGGLLGFSSQLIVNAIMKQPLGRSML
jgi:hypothetical protein